MNSKIFSDLLEFVRRAHKVKPMETERTTVIQEIPTAALITGEDKIKISILVIDWLQLPVFLIVDQSLSMGGGGDRGV